MVIERKNPLPTRILGFIIAAAFLTFGLAVARGDISLLSLWLKGPSADDYLFPSSKRKNIWGWANQSIENWRFQHYDVVKGRVDWIASGDRAWPHEELDDCFRFSNIRLELLIDLEDLRPERDKAGKAQKTKTGKKAASKAPAQTTVITADFGQAQFQHNQSIELTLGQASKDQAGQRVRIVGDGFEATLDQLTLTIPARLKNQADPEESRKKALQDRARQHEFTVAELQARAQGQVVLRLGAKYWQDLEDGQKPISETLYLRSQEGFRIDEQQVLHLQGPVLLRVPPSLVNSSSQSKAKKPRERPKKTSALEESLQQGLNIRCLRAKIRPFRTLVLKPPPAPKPKPGSKPSSKPGGKAVEPPSSSIRGAFVELTGRVRVYERGQGRALGHCDQLKAWLHMSHEAALPMRALGGPSALAMRALDKTKDAELSRLEAIGHVWFQGNLAKSDDEPRVMTFTGERWFWDEPRSLIEVEGQPAQALDGQSFVEAERLVLKDTLEFQQLTAQGQVHAWFERSAKKTGEGPLKVKAQADWAQFFWTERQQAKPKNPKRKERVRELESFVLKGQPAHLDQQQQDYERRLEAQTIEWSRLSREGLLTGQVKLFQQHSEVNKDQSRSSQTIRGAGERLRVVLKNDPFKDLGRSLKDKKDDPEKKAKKGKDKGQKDGQLVTQDDIESFELKGSPAQLSLKDKDGVKRELKAARVAYKDSGEGWQFEPEAGRPMEIRSSDGQTLLAPYAHWDQDMRLLHLKSPQGQEPVTLADEHGNLLKARQLVLHRPPSKSMEDAGFSYGPEIFIDVVGEVHMKLPKPDKFMNFKRNRDKDRDKDKTPKKAKKKDKKDKTPELPPLEVSCEHAHLVLRESDDPEAQTKLSKLLLTGQRERWVKIVGKGQDKREQFTIQGPVFRLWGSDSQRFLRAVSQGQQFPRMHTKAGDFLTGETIQLVFTKDPRDAWQAKVDIAGSVRGRFTPELPQDKKAKKAKDPSKKPKDPNPVDFNSKSLEVELDIAALRAVKNGELWRALKKLDARDNVQIEDQTVRAWGDRLEYNGQTGRGQLTGKPARVFQKKEGGPPSEMPVFRFRAELSQSPAKGSADERKK